MARTETPLVGGRYRILDELGRGGYATVYRARDERCDREVALKLLTLARSQDERACVRFMREVEVASGIRHPRAVRILDAGRDSTGSLWLAMELVRGETLRATLGRLGTLPEAAVLKVARQTLSLLDAAHRSGVIHRDVKPENIMLSPEGPGRVSVRLLDFGMARALRHARGITLPDAAIGTPAYMSPEQARGERVDARADIYALGVTLYEALSGRLPFDIESVEGDPAFAYVIASLTTQPRPLESGVSPTTAAAVMRAIARRPRDRWSDARAFRLEIDRARRHLERSTRTGAADEAAPVAEKWAPADTAGARVRIVTGATRAPR